MKAGRNAGKADVETTFQQFLYNLLEEHGFIGSGRGMQPVQSFVHGVEDLEVLGLGTHALEPAGEIEGGIAGCDHGSLRTLREDLTLQSAGEGLHRVLLQVSAGEMR